MGFTASKNRNFFIVLLIYLEYFFFQFYSYSTLYAFYSKLWFQSRLSKFLENYSAELYEILHRSFKTVDPILIFFLPSIYSL